MIWPEDVLISLISSSSAGIIEGGYNMVGKYMPVGAIHSPPILMRSLSSITPSLLMSSCGESNLPPVHAFDSWRIDSPPAEQAVEEGIGKALFLIVHDPVNKAPGSHEFAVVRPHDVDDPVCDSMKKGLIETEDLTEANGPANDSSQDVAAAFVRGHNAVPDQEGGGPRVIGDHPKGNVSLRVRPVFFFAEALYLGNQIRKQVGVVVGRDA